MSSAARVAPQMVARREKHVLLAALAGAEGLRPGRSMASPPWMRSQKAGSCAVCLVCVPYLAAAPMLGPDLPVTPLLHCGSIATPVGEPTGSAFRAGHRFLPAPQTARPAGTPVVAAGGWQVPEVSNTVGLARFLAAGRLRQMYTRGADLRSGWLLCV